MAAVTDTTQAIKRGLKVDQQRAGVVYCRSAKYVNDGAKDANSIIKMVPVPAGARIVKVDYKTSALGTGVTVDIGNATTVDKYVDGANCAAAGSASSIHDVELAADEDIQMKILGAVLPDEAVLSLHVWYKMADSIKDEIA